VTCLPCFRAALKLTDYGPIDARQVSHELEESVRARLSPRSCTKR